MFKSLAFAVLFALPASFSSTFAVAPQIPKRILLDPITSKELKALNPEDNTDKIKIGKQGDRIKLNASSLTNVLNALNNAVKSEENLKNISEGLSKIITDEIDKTSSLVTLKQLAQKGDLIDRLIFAAHRAYRESKKEAMDLGKKTWEETDYGKAVLLLEATVHDLMDDRGLRETLAAVLDTGFVLTDSGNSEIKDARNSLQKAPAGIITWESKHFGEDGNRKVDFSFGGEMGMLPTLGLVVRSDGEPDPATNKVMTIRSLMQNAFRWKICGRVNVTSGESGESSFFGGFGQTVRWNDSESVGTADAPLTTRPVDNGVGRAATFWEIGGQYRLFDNPRDIVHDDKTYISPIFTASAGIRGDNRFRRFRDLAGFENPEMRWFATVQVDLKKVIDKRAEGDTPKSFGLTFGVEWETALRSGRPGVTVPSGTKIFLNASIDILSTLQRGKTK